jgi:Protein of unknown function (DUF3000).
VAEVRSSDGEPAEFTRAVEALTAAALRPDVAVEPLPPPRRLAPWSFALGARVAHGGQDVATGRLVLLHDPAGHEAWHGTLRLVAFATAELDGDMARDPLLPEVAWSWLLDALAEHDAGYAAAGGTVTLIASTRFGDLAERAPSTDIELRGSWTPQGDLGAHLRAWGDLLCSAAGLPPPGVALLPLSPGQGRNGL